MEEARDPESAVDTPDDAGKESSRTSRNDDATSDATLGDLEQTQKSSEGRSGTTTGDSSSNVTPSPDGAFDEKGSGRADGGDSGGPM
ncbi:MAG TPA: hypothetical protein VGB73_01470 [Pyrinomonadaceae bacterium]|jgi:hypothetical protein